MLQIAHQNIYKLKVKSKSQSYSIPFKSTISNWCGSGFLVDNKLVTNYHVIEGAVDILCISNSNEKAFKSKVLIASKEMDLAILEYKGDKKGFEFGELLNITDKVYILGHTNCKDINISKGHVFRYGYSPQTGVDIEIENNIITHGKFRRTSKLKIIKLWAFYTLIIQKIPK